MKSDTPETITDYAEALPAGQSAICHLLQREIDAALPQASAKIWHGSPVWFIGGNPVVGYHATPKQVNLLFWNGQSFGDAALKAVGKGTAAQIQFTDATQIDTKTLRGWLKRAGTEIYDYQNHFKTQRALRKKGKT
jgi:hypothetical protein